MHRPDPPAAPLMLGQRPVGSGHPTYVIAEAGVNHDGSVARALELVDVAAAAGADAVKFQVFRAAELASAAAGAARYQRAGGAASQRVLLAPLELDDDAFARVAAHCRQHGIEFLATPFGVPDVARLESLGVRAIKIASTDLDNLPLLRRAAATGLPLIVSTGAATRDEITTAVARLEQLGAGRRLALLHCVSSYPTPLDAANLRAVATLAATFGVPAGYSDHTAQIETGAWAVAAGAALLEKHFTHDRAARGPDHAMSLDGSGLRAYIAAVRQVERSLGSGALGMTSLEAEVRAVARKSVVAARPLSAGMVLTPDALTTKRPGGGITPDQLDALIGRRVAGDVPADTVLTWDMIQ